MKFPSLFRRDRFSPPVEIDDAVLTLARRETGKIEWPMSRTYGRFLLSATFIILALLAGRLVYLNVIEGDRYAEIARRNSLRTLVLPAPRGVITDRYGAVLADNVPSIDAFLLPAALPPEPDRTSVVERIRTLLGLDVSAWQETLADLDLGKPLLIKKNLAAEEIVRVLKEESSLPGLTLAKSVRRTYPDGPTFAHVIGYEGRIQKDDLDEYPGYTLTDSVGQQGMEKEYERLLRGRPGSEPIEVDARGQFRKALGIHSPVPGQDLTLTLDAELQRTVSRIVNAWLEKRGLRQAAVIAMDPRDGSILSLASFPSFDNNLFAAGLSRSDYERLITDPGKPLFNRAIGGAYPPGSTIKPIYAAAALAEGTITPQTTIESRGGITVGRSFFGDWKAHGFTDLRRAIAVSSDVYFYSVGGGYGSVRGLGIDRLKRYAELFGLGQRSGIDLPGEVTGLFPSPTWKQERLGERWYIGDDYNSSIGQGFITATPLQILNATAAIANGGTLYRPHLLAETKTADGLLRRVGEPIAENLLRPDILQIVREGMRQTVIEGTAQSLKDSPVPVAGKTGTAQFGTEEKTHGWFVSFAPFDEPRFALIVLVEGQGEEGYNAVPITKDILTWYFSRPE